MNTLESLYRALGTCDDRIEGVYERARTAKVAEIAEYLEAQGFIAPRDRAEWAMQRAEEMGRIVGNEVTFEIPSRATPTGHPLVATV